VIPVDLGIDSRDRLVAAGAVVFWLESALDHAIDPGFVRELQPWLRAAVAA
jgi:predicted esterase